MPDRNIKNNQSPDTSYPKYELDGIGIGRPEDYIAAKQPDGQTKYRYTGPRVLRLAQIDQEGEITPLEHANYLSATPKPMPDSVGSPINLHDRQRGTRRVTRRQVLFGALVVAGAGLTSAGADALYESLRGPGKWEHTVVEGDTLWDLVVERYNVSDPTWINSFIETNITNHSADQENRPKEELQIGDELEIINPESVPSADDD